MPDGHHEPLGGRPISIIHTSPSASTANTAQIRLGDSFLMQAGSSTQIVSVETLGALSAQEESKRPLHCFLFLISSRRCSLTKSKKARAYNYKYFGCVSYNV
jgi:hypothetical protein